MINVHVSKRGVYTQIIHVNFEEFSQVVFEGMIHQPLECRRSICQAKGHYPICKYPKLRDKGCLVFIIGVDGYLIVA